MRNLIVALFLIGSTAYGQLDVIQWDLTNVANGDTNSSTQKATGYIKELRFDFSGASTPTATVSIVDQAHVHATRRTLWSAELTGDENFLPVQQASSNATGVAEFIPIVLFKSFLDVEITGVNKTNINIEIDLLYERR